MVRATDTVPELRLRRLNAHPIRTDGRYILYWMTSARRPCWNYALDRAVELAHRLGKPLVVLEALRCDYRWASDRFHKFILQGMRDNAAAFEAAGVTYHPYVEPERGAGKGLLRALGEQACVVIADDSPASFYPAMLAAAAEQLSVRIEAIDSNGLLPLRATSHAYSRAVDLRRFLQHELWPHLASPPRKNPLSRTRLERLSSLPRDVLKRWPGAPGALLAGEPSELGRLPIDHSVGAVGLTGGAREGRKLARRFISARLSGYAEASNHPDENATSGLSPYLHFGHIGPHEVFDLVRRSESWSVDQLLSTPGDSHSGWWNMSVSAESFLDQLVTWRELGLNFATHRDDIDRFDSLPQWAAETLQSHAEDARPFVYSRAEFEGAETHDELWNAAQTELRASGSMHTYLRMLWGKKILHWSRDPRSALETMLELNDRYALDGRDPNSYSGIFWVLGRYDRAWGPERDVFGKVRFMSSQSTRRKLRLNNYLATWNHQVEAKRGSVA